MSGVVALDTLPEGWTCARLTDVAEVNPPKPARDALPADAPVSFVPMPAVDAAAGAITGAQERVFAAVRKGYTAFADGDVLLAKITPCFENGKAAVAAGLRNGVGFGSSEFHVLRSRGAVLPEYLHHFVRQPAFREIGAEHMIGTAGQARVPVEFVRDVDVPVPPLAEQRRIVEIVDVTLARIAAARHRLASVRGTVARFRRGVLAAACAGRLTEDVRAEHPQRDRAVLDAAEGEDSVGWPLLRAAAACTSVQSGGTPKGRSFTPAGDIPFLKVYNIVGQRVAFGYKPQFITRDVHAGELRRSVVAPNDVLMNIVGPPLGKVALVPDTYPEWNMNQALVLFRAQTFLLPEFLYYVLSEGSEVRRIESDYRGSAGQSNISLSQCRDFRIPVPSVEEQRAISERVGSAFALADAVERRATAALAHVDKLPQAILTKAFTGQLVPTEAELARVEGRGFEPAEAMLARFASAPGGARPRSRRQTPAVRP